MEHTSLMFDEIMTKHEKKGHPESPERLKQIVNLFKENGIWERCHHTLSREAEMEELLLCHTQKVIDAVLEADFSECDMIHFDSDTFMNRYSSQAARTAVGGLINLTTNVVTETDGVKNGFAIVRPPGHHAERDRAMGFCLFNNVAIAAEYAIQSLGCSRVLIFDWDVHHGNGTQHIFEDRNDIMFMSVHKGGFYPGTGYHRECGKGEGLGYTVNVPFMHPDMNDADYIYAMDELFMPIAREFNPDIVFVSAGFDCAAGDPLGPMSVTEIGFQNMIHRLMELTDGKVILALEGGYECDISAKCAAAVIKILLGDETPGDITEEVSEYAMEDVLRTKRFLKPHWPDCIDLGSEEVLTVENVTS